MSEREFSIVEANVLGEFPYIVLEVRWSSQMARMMDRHMNGYVGVPAGHPWFERPYQDFEDGVEVHGGLTFSGRMTKDVFASKDNPFAGMDIWWMGFDTCHFDDHDKQGRWRHSLDYMRKECGDLAEAAAKAM